MAKTWLIAALVAGLVLLSLTLTASRVGVPAWEYALYHRINNTIAPDLIPVFHWITRLGSESVLFPASMLFIFALPDQHLRRWWLWVAVMLISSFVEGEMKSIVGRPRPEDLRPGFPSGHTAAAAAFFSMAAYLAQHTVRNRRARLVLWGVVVLAILAVALSRIVLRVHWPLDTVGGAALGLVCLAIAAWWNERNPIRLSARPRLVWTSVQTWIHRWPIALPLPFFSVLFLTSPMVAEDSPLDLVFDVGGVAIVAAGLAVRAWALGYTGVPTSETAGRDWLVTSGPYRLVRHPAYVGNFLIALGIVVLAENALGLIVIPTAFFGVYRLIATREEGALRRRFGPAYDEYCRAVPRWVPGRGSAPLASSRPFRWAALKNEYRAIGGAAAMAIVAEVSEFMPHLFG